MKDCIQLRLSPSPGVASTCRTLLVQELPGWGMAELADDAGLVVTELVANAAGHVGENFGLEIRADDDGLLVQVSDSSPRLPVVRDLLADLDDPDPDAVGGRGLLLVDSLASTWGCDRHDGGKTVWARLLLPCYEAEFSRPAYGTGAVMRRYVTFRSGASDLTALELRARVLLAGLPRVGSVDRWTLVGIRRVDDGQARRAGGGQ